MVGLQRKLLASNTGDAQATRADPVILRDGDRGRIAIVHQTAFKDNPKGEVAAEIMINYLFTEAAQETPPETTTAPLPEVTLTASTNSPLTGANLHGGVVTLTLSGRQFAHAFIVSRALTIDGIEGVTFNSWDVKRINDTKVTVGLTFSGNIDADTSLTFTLGAGGITDYDGDVLNAQLPVTAVEVSLVATTETPLTEANLHGSVVTLTLSGRSFNEKYYVYNAVTVSGIEGASFYNFGVNRISPTKVTVPLTYYGNIDADATLTITVGENAIIGYNKGFTFEFPVAALEESLVATTETPLTEANLHGSVVTLTLSGRSFNDEWHADNALTISGIDGVTFDWWDVDRIIPTKVTVPLKFSGNIDTDATLTITVGENAIIGYNQVLTLQLPVTAVTESLVATTDTPLTEVTLSGSVVTLTLSGRRFTDSEWEIEKELTVSGIEGITVAQGFRDGVERVSDTEVTLPLRFSGNIDADATFTITVGENAIVGYNQALTAQLPVTAVEEMLDAATEENPHLNVVKLTLSGRQFAIGGWTLKDTLTISNNDENTVEILDAVLVSDNEMTVNLGFNGDFNNDVVLTITLGADAISRYTGPALTAEVTVTPIAVSLTASTESISLEVSLREGEIVLMESPLSEAYFLFSIRLRLSGRQFADRWSDALTFSSPDGRIVGVSEDDTEVEIKGEIIEIDEIDNLENLNDIGFVRIDDEEHVSDSEVLIGLVFSGDLSADATLTLDVGADAILEYNEDFTFEFPVTAVEESLTATPEFPLTEENIDGNTVRLSTGRQSWLSLDLDEIQEEGALTISGIEGVTIEEIRFPWSGWLLSLGDPTIRLGFYGDFDIDETLTITVKPGVIAGYGKELSVEVPVTATQQSDATVSVSPSPIVLPAIGEKLTLNLDIANGENVAGYQVNVWFDHTVLRYVESANRNYLPANAFFTEPILDDYIWIRNTSVEDTSSLTIAGNTLAEPRNGDGTLATITFEILDYKPSTVTLAEVYLADPTGKQWEVTIKNGELLEPPELNKKNFVDLNLDGVVDIHDLAIIKDRFGQTGQNIADINGDLLVDIVDLVLVAAAFEGAAAPAFHQETLEMLTAAEVQQWISQAQYLDPTDLKVQRGILFLEQLLTVLTPKETALLVNFPNPFNPETWIPFQLAKPADVSITIYAVDGQMIRRIALGHQPAGRYHNRSRAAYWDGKNAYGEPMASGLYFYTFTAGNFTATRKMLIRK